MRALLAIAAASLATPALAQAAEPHTDGPMHNPQASSPHAGHQTGPAGPPAAAAPPVPTDRAADSVFPPEEMAAAREGLRHEHGDIRWSTLMVETLEYRPARGEDGYGWRARASFGGDLDRLVLKTEGEGEGRDLERGEIQALLSRAVGPYFDLHAGVRQDFQSGPSRTFATVGIEGLAPYGVDVESALFLSNRGDLSARMEASTDLRLTQRLILQPRAEANLAAQDDRAAGVGSGLSDLELGLRLRYAIRPEFAPYVGVNWSRAFGDTADIARADGRDVEQTRFVLGVRAWF
jgi:copper resistance protein B